jgi:hypothetical protein
MTLKATRQRRTPYASEKQGHALQGHGSASLKAMGMVEDEEFGRNDCVITGRDETVSQRIENNAFTGIKSSRAAQSLRATCEDYREEN